MESQAPSSPATPVDPDRYFRSLGDLTRLRMLVLLHFHTIGFSPVQLAYLFLLYEVMGVLTNLSAGWLLVIQPTKLSAVREALEKIEVTRMSVCDAQGFGQSAA